MKQTFLFLVVAVGLLGAMLAYVSRPSHTAAAGNPSAAVHDHGDEGLKITRYDEKTQVYLEFQRLVVGAETTFAAHMTRLPDFKAIDKGTVTLSLLMSDGTVVDTVSVNAPTVPGIFRPVMRPQRSGEFQLRLRFDAGAVSSMHELGHVTVYGDPALAAAAAQAEHVETPAAISYSKEQQWKAEFASAEVTQRAIRASVSATGTLRAEPDAEATLVAPTPGTLVAAGIFPHVGQSVSKGQVLAYLLPRLGGDTDLATLEAAARKARVAFESAQRERERMEALFAQEAVAEKRLQAARAEEKIAGAELDAAARRLGQRHGEDGGIPLRAPLAGTLVDVRGGPGAFVNEGQLVFHIAERNRLWLEARVAESDIGRMSKPQGAWFSVDGIDGGFAVEEGTNGHLVAVGGAIDPTTRTVPVVFQLNHPDARLRIGMNAKVALYAHGSRTTVAVPISAVIDESGQAIVYVEKSGESYERRPVSVGARDGEFVEIKSGLAAGERIVSKGAYQVRLASLSPAAVGHGHVH